MGYLQLDLFLTSSGHVSVPRGLQTKLFPTPMPIVESKAPLKTPVSEKLANTLLFRYPRKMDQNRILHFKYWIGILLGVIVLIIAEAWGGEAKIADKVNFAVGVTSVILAVLA